MNIKKDRMGTISVSSHANHLVQAHVAHIAKTWAFLLKQNESISSIELSDRIAQLYDIHNARTLFDISFLRRISYES
jgi:hypothetical protein